MSIPSRSLQTLLVFSVLTTLTFAESRDSGSRLTEASRLPTTGTKIPTAPLDDSPTIPISVLTDSMYDYEVWSAPDVSGQTEWVIWGRLPSGQWEEMHRYDWLGTADHGGWTDMGVWKFSSEYSATQAAENMLEDGEIIDFTVIEQAKQPHWTYEETFDTRAEAESYAAEIEHWSNEFGNPHVTDVRSILVNDLFTVETTADTSLKLTR